jgi:hypothetical protein
MGSEGGRRAINVQANRARPPQGQGHNSRVMGAGSRRLSRRALSRVTARRTRRSARRIRRRRIMTWPRWCSCASRRPHPPGRDALGRQGKRSTFHPSVAAIIGRVVVVLTFPALIVARADREAAHARLGDRVSRILRAPTVDRAALLPVPTTLRRRASQRRGGPGQRCPEAFLRGLCELRRPLAARYPQSSRHPRPCIGGSLG